MGCWKSWKISGTKWADWAACGSVCMLQALETLLSPYFLGFEECPFPRTINEVARPCAQGLPYPLA